MSYDPYDYQAEYDNFDTDPFETLGDTNWYGGGSYNLNNDGSFFTPQEYASAGTDSSGNSLLNKITGLLGGTGAKSLLNALNTGIGAWQQGQTNTQNSQQQLDYLNKMSGYSSPADFPANVDPASVRAMAQGNYKQSQGDLNAFQDDPNSHAGNAANKAQIFSLLSKKNALSGWRGNPDALSTSLASAFADSDMKWQELLMKDRDSTAMQSGLGQFYNPQNATNAMQAIAGGNQGIAPYSAGLASIINQGNYASNPDILAMLKQYGISI